MVCMMVFTPPLSSCLDGDLGYDVMEGGEETSKVEDMGWTGLVDRPGGRSPMRRKMPSRSLRRIPSIHSAVMTLLVEYSG